MALKWTKTWGPPSLEMNPKPFASLNHFTVPVMRAITLSFPLQRGLTVTTMRPVTQQCDAQSAGKFCASVWEDVRYHAPYAAPAASAMYFAVLPQLLHFS